MAKEKSRAEGLELGGLTDRFGYVIRRAQMAVFAEFAGMLKDLDLTPAQYSVLLLIGCNPGTSQRMLCESLGILKSNFVALIHRFEERGLAERRPDGRDARANALHLTRKNINIRGIGLASGSPAVANGVAEYVDGLFQPPIVTTNTFYNQSGNNEFFGAPRTFGVRVGKKF